MAIVSVLLFLAFMFAALAFGVWLGSRFTRAAYDIQALIADGSRAAAVDDAAETAAEDAS